ncbi:MAG: fasciclin domain-containing protein [Chitinophaga sp.]|uniref:fasciclin domain-containing protein n=1 Tax=Chitinophaga sp. TaxID=1869181 RepID=UPI001B1454B8|nr:fasciclin domain-containing protein [Chitinophaga sp.]MBO9727303.1 fasciclin domain-containing protein [Chitinophaga sp.]
MTSRISLLLLLLLSFAACKKQDIEPEPVGEAIPYKPGPDKTWQQQLAASPYTRFREAWQRAGMDETVKKGGAGFYTLLVPDDKAFDEAGWTSDKIKNTDAATLTSLLTYYVMPARLVPESIASVNGSTPTATLSSRELTGRDEWYGTKYTDFLFPAKSGDSLIINGNALAKWGQYLEGSNGIIYPIEHLIAQPQQTMWEYLQSQPQFSLYVDAIRISDSLYASVWMNEKSAFLKSSPTFAQFTLFAPTNEAFIKNGFHNADDILQFNLRSWPLPDPGYDDNMFWQTPSTAMDSILNACGPEVATASQLDLNYRVGPVYFSNDLVNNASGLSGIVLRAGQRYNEGPVIIRLSFINNNGQPGIRRINTNYPYIPLKQKNTRVINGVVHEVDDLFKR